VSWKDVQPASFARRSTPPYLDARINGFKYQQTVNQHSYVKSEKQTNTKDTHADGFSKYRQNFTPNNVKIGHSDKKDFILVDGNMCRLFQRLDVKPSATVTRVTLQDLGERLMACTCPVPDTPC
jgi:hypothetical protein